MSGERDVLPWMREAARFAIRRSIAASIQYAKRGGSGTIHTQGDSDAPP